MSAPDWQALGDAVRERRYELALSMEALVEHGGPSHQIVRNIEHGAPGPYRPQTFYKLERALQWPRGHVDRVLSGLAVDEVVPAHIPSTSADDGAPDWQALGDAVRDRRADLGFRQADIELHGGPGVGTIRNVEQASRTSYSRGTLRQLERALQWPRGHVDRVLAGHPAEVEDGGTQNARTVVVVHDLTVPDWRALGDAVHARRTALRLPQDLAEHGGPSEFTVRKIERAETTAIRPGTRTGLEHALRWPRGHVDRVLAGLPVDPVPVPVEDRRTTPILDDRTIADVVDDAHALRVGRLVIALWRELAAVEDGATAGGRRLVAPVDKVTIPWHS